MRPPITAFLCSFLWLMSVSASDPVTMDLWSDGAPGVTENQEGDVPQLILRKVDSKEPTPAIVILPGGGYSGHAMDHEGHQISDWMQSLGIASAICTYRLRGKGNAGKGYGHPAPMQDAQRAIQTMRANAAQWNVDPNRIGILGFSAGGHLCSTVSTQFLSADANAADPIERVSSRPDFSILCYPVIMFDSEFAHKGSQRNLLGKEPDPELLQSLSNEKRVTVQTPPTFLFHTAEDTAVPPQNSIEYYRACLENGVHAELHIFPNGRHGLGLAKNVPGASQWPKLCETWMKCLWSDDQVSK